MFLKINKKLIFVFPLIFTVVDFLFPKIFRHTIGDGLIGLYYFIQIIDVTGMTGVILTVMFCNLGLFYIIKLLILKKEIKFINYSFIIPVIIILIYGFLRVGYFHGIYKDLKFINGAMIQGNISGKEKSDLSLHGKNVDRYNNLTREADKNKTLDLIIWPESVFTRSYDGTEKSLQKLVYDNYKNLILGTTIWNIDETTDKYIIYNSALLINNKQVKARYDKNHLLMFGEYVPFSKYLPFLKYLTPLNYSMKPGDTPSVFAVGDRIKACISICFEGIFPDKIRDKVNEGSNLMVNITNDSWYGKTVGPVHHSAISRLRAIENRRSYFRCTATGVTTASDLTGKVVAIGKVWLPVVVTGRVPLYDKRTVYSYIGEFFSYLCIAVLILIIICYFALKIKGRLTEIFMYKEFNLQKNLGISKNLGIKKGLGLKKGLGIKRLL